MRGPHTFIDVQAIWCAANGDDAGTQFMKHLRRNLIGRAVRRVHHNLQPTQRELVVKRALAELDVAPRCIFQAAGFTKTCGVHPGRLFQQSGFNFLFPGVWQLRALGTEEFDAIVIKRIVTGTDHHTQASPLGTRQISHARRRQRPQQHDIHASRRKARLQRALQHIARNTGVLANQHQRTLLRAAQHAPHRMGQTQCEIRRNRRLAYCSANTVGTKILTSHGFCILFFSIKHSRAMP